MADGERVETCNTELKSLLAEVEGHRENPRFISLIKSLIKLTGTPEDDEAMSPKIDPKEQERQRIAAEIAKLQKQAAAL